MQRKLNIIWQVQVPSETEWIEEVFGGIFGEQISDGRHVVVADNSLLIDSCIHRHPSDYYEKFRGKNAFLLHLSDETYAGGYGCYDHFRGVFRNYWSAVFRPQRVFTLPLGYCNGLRHSGPTTPASKRSYIWAFLGQLSKASRPDMVRALADVTPNFCHDKGMRAQSTLPPPEYKQILLDSTFSPCSMGNVNLDSFRLYESLECGSIPIVEKRLTLDYFGRLLGQHPLPAVRTWRAARALIHRLMHKAEALDNLQQQCIQWWAEYKSKLRSDVLAFLQRCSAEKSELHSISSWQSLPFWQSWEICRHHSFLALARRVRRAILKPVHAR